MPAIEWERAAEKELAEVPFFVQAMVRRKGEEGVEENGDARVEQADFQQACERLKKVMAGKSESRLKNLAPKANEPGVEMVVIETCRNELSNCPNVLIKTAEWERAFRRWADDRGLSEKLRSRVRGDKVLFHHKLRVSISGCPNACSRPQIADVGVTGFTIPAVVPELCMMCGECEAVCPDNAVTVDNAPPVFDCDACLGCHRCRKACPEECITNSKPGARLMLGGKLGRRPRLAQVAGEFQRPHELIKCVDEIVDDFVKKAMPGERFSEYRARSRGATSATRTTCSSPWRTKRCRRK